MSRPYTLAGDPAVEKIIGDAVAAIAEDIGELEAAPEIRAVALGGGYGRGEGGVLRRAPAPNAPYNDLDFFVISRSGNAAARRRIGVQLTALGRLWTQKLGIDVDFGAARPLGYVARRLDVMMWNELVRDCRIVYGDTHVFDAFSGGALPPPPPSECARLLMNRAMGLLLARARLDGETLSAEDADFVARNTNKALLAAGDAWLLAHGDPVFTARARLATLETRAAFGGTFDAELRDAYRDAVAFKRYPNPECDTHRARARWDVARDLLLSSAKALAPQLATAQPRGLRRLAQWRALLSARACLRACGGDAPLFGSSVSATLRLVCARLADTAPFSRAEAERFVRLWARVN